MIMPVSAIQLLLGQISENFPQKRFTREQPKQQQQ